MGLVIGGIIPAILLGIFGVLQKAANNEGVGTGSYLIVTGMSVTLLGVIVYFLFPEKSLSPRGLLFTSGGAILWAISILLIQLALSNYSVEISKLVPLFNMNTLVAVLLGMLIFAEWSSLNLFTLILGALCITVGGILVALA